MKLLVDTTILKDGRSFQETLANRKLKLAEDIKNQKAFSFKDIFGDLSSYTYKGGFLDLSNLNLNSLEGCPRRVSESEFKISNNCNLTSLKYFPEVTDFYIISLDYSATNSFNELDLDNYRNAEGIICVITEPQEVNLKTLKIQLVTSFSKLRGLHGNFNGLDILTYDPELQAETVDKEAFESLYILYEKLNFDKEKLIRVVELL